MALDTSAFVYVGGKILKSPTGQLIKVNYASTVTLDGKTYNTFKMPVYINEGGQEYAKRQEWMVDNIDYDFPSSQTFSYNTSDPNWKYKWEYYWSSGNLAKRSITTSSSQDADYCKKAFEVPLSTPRCLVYNQRKYYNDAAIIAIDSHYKSLGWRVPIVEDYINLAKYWSSETQSLAEAICPEFNGRSFGAVYGNLYAWYNQGSTPGLLQNEFSPSPNFRVELLSDYDDMRNISIVASTNSEELDSSSPSGRFYESPSSTNFCRAQYLALPTNSNATGRKELTETTNIWISRTIVPSCNFAGYNPIEHSGYTDRINVRIGIDASNRQWKFNGGISDNAYFCPWIFYRGEKYASFYNVRLVRNI